MHSREHRRDVLVAMATHIIAQKGLNNLVTHNRTLLDEVDSAKVSLDVPPMRGLCVTIRMQPNLTIDVVQAVATNTKYKIKRGASNTRRRSEGSFPSVHYYDSNEHGIVTI